MPICQYLTIDMHDIQGFHFEGFFLFKEIFAIARKKQEIQNERKYEGN